MSGAFTAIMLLLTEFISQEETRRSYFICKSIRKISMMMLGKRTGADLLFSGGVVGGGYVHVMKFFRQKTHSYVEARIAEVDEILESNDGSGSTWFESIGGNERKVRSFGVGGRQQDPLFRTVFDVYNSKVDGEYQTQPGVQKWSPGVVEEVTDDKIPASSNESVILPESMIRLGKQLKELVGLQSVNTALLAELHGCADRFDELAISQRAEQEERDELRAENAELESEVLEANHKISIMEDVMGEFCGPAAMEETRKRLSRDETESSGLKRKSRDGGGD